jgi:endonuclease I
MLSVYDRASINVAAINPGGSIPGWDSGATWNREHTWPQSRGITSTSIPDGTDLFELRPVSSSENGSRSNLNYGGAFGQPFGRVTDNGATYWYPGDADAGMIAREEFYMAVRYDGSESGTTDLELVSGNPASGGSLMGNLDRLIEWHFAAPPDDFERRRNQVIYTNYQHNRDPFTDRPELAWSVFVNQQNDSQITINGGTLTGSGGSTRDVNLGRVFVGAAVPAAQSFTLNKGGLNGTYYSVAASGAATSSLNGHYNAFRTNQTDAKSITVGLNTTTSAAGVRTGTVTVDNLDVTSGAGAGHGALDGNDVFNVSLNVLDHATPSFATPSLTTSLSHDFGILTAGSASPTFDFDIFDLNTTIGSTANLDVDGISLASGNAGTFSTNLAPLSIVAGSGHTFAAMINTATTGSFSATYTLMLSDENIAGAQNKTLTLTLSGQIAAAGLAGDYDNDGVVDAVDYLIWRKSAADGVPLLYNETASPGITDDQDYSAWRANFGATAPGAGSRTVSAGATIPEPSSTALIVLACSGLQLVSVRKRVRVIAILNAKLVLTNPFSARAAFCGIVS